MQLSEYMHSFRHVEPTWPTAFSGPTRSNKTRLLYCASPAQHGE